MPLTFDHTDVRGYIFVVAVGFGLPISAALSLFDLGGWAAVPAVLLLCGSLAVAGRIVQYVRLPVDDEFRSDTSSKADVH